MSDHTSAIVPSSLPVSIGSHTDAVATESATAASAATPRPATGRRYAAPAVDVFEGPHGWLVRADVPGVQPDGVSVHLDKNRLTLQADRHDSLEGRRLWGRPRADGYRRTLVVPEIVDADAIQARLSNGVLEVTLPRDRRAVARQIAVTVT